MDDSGYLSQPKDKYGQAIIAVTDTKPLLDEAEFYFRRQRKDSDGKLVSFGKPMMNEEGINYIIGQLQGVVNRTQIFSHMDKRQVVDQVLMMLAAIIKKLMTSKAEFNIDTDADRTAITTYCTNIAWSTALRSLDGNEKKFWQKIVQETIAKITTNDKQGNFLSKMLPNQKG